MAATILLTGFGPWGSYDENPTSLVVDRIARAGRPGLATLVLPVDSAGLSHRVADALAQHRPAIWLGLGLAMGSAVVAVERVAVNIRDFEEADITGARLADTSVVDGAPAAYRATLPVGRLVQRLHGAGIPARASDTAGTFLCNQLMYTVLHTIAARGLPVQAGFVHLPAHPALVARQRGRAGAMPSMALETAVIAVDTLLASLASGQS